MWIRQKIYIRFTYRQLVFWGASGWSALNMTVLVQLLCNMLPNHLLDLHLQCFICHWCSLSWTYPCYWFQLSWTTSLYVCVFTVTTSKCFCQFRFQRVLNDEQTVCTRLKDPSVSIRYKVIISCNPFFRDPETIVCIQPSLKIYDSWNVVNITYLGFREEAI